jgi:large subunit ribosomal protein L29
MPRRIEKIRESSGDELRVQERELTEQIFRLRFQLSTGQAEALKRLRDARKDLARVKTHLREQELNGNAGSGNGTQKSAERSEKAATAKSSVAKTVTAKPAKKKSAESSSKTKKAGKA